MKTKAIPAGEVAYIIRKHLGPLRAWSDFLSDNIRGKQNVGGFTLSPCAKMRGRCKRPMYDVRDVVNFIGNVRAAGLASPEPEKFVTLDVDLDMETPWFLRIYDTDGKPTTLH